MAQTVKWMLFPYRQYVLTITTDNSTEFAEHKIISTMLNTDIYFTDPYFSWQKGNIEHTNKLIRQYIPKGTDFDTIDEKNHRTDTNQNQPKTKRKTQFYDTKGLLFQTFLLILHFDVESANNRNYTQPLLNPKNTPTFAVGNKMEVMYT